MEENNAIQLLATVVVILDESLMTMDLKQEGGKRGMKQLHSVTGCKDVWSNYCLMPQRESLEFLSSLAIITQQMGAILKCEPSVEFGWLI